MPRIKICVEYVGGKQEVHLVQSMDCIYEFDGFGVKGFPRGRIQKTFEIE